MVGNVTQRQNNALGLTESFCYDNVYRLDHSTLTAACTGSTNLQMAYDATGNITARSDIAAGAAWTYSTTHKHQALQAGDASHTYTYDANGNAITRNSQTIGWTSYNLPNLINATGESSTFTYGPRHEKWTQVYTGPSGTETTTYYGKLLETVVTSAGTDWRHYIFAGSEQVAIYSRTSGGTNTLRYSLEDHLGSPSAITSSTGTLLVNENFAAYGAQRNPTTWSGAPPPGDLTTIAGITRQGYTGQTMLGNMGLVHMNGRVMDAITGRFLSADPFITEPGNTQNFNRYGYVYNNPLSYVDPSGFELVRVWDSHSNSWVWVDDSPPVEITIEGTRDNSDQGTFNNLDFIDRSPPVTHNRDDSDVRPTDDDPLEEVVVTATKPKDDKKAQSPEPLCKASTNPFTVELSWTVDIQPPLLPGVGGGFGIGITSNGQFYFSFTAQGELGEVLNLSTGPQLTWGRDNGSMPVRQPSTENFIGAQYAVGMGPVASGGWTRSESGNSFAKGVGKLGGGFAGQVAMVAGTNTRIAMNKPICK